MKCMIFWQAEESHNFSDSSVSIPVCILKGQSHKIFDRIIFCQAEESTQNGVACRANAVENLGETTGTRLPSLQVRPTRLIGIFSFMGVYCEVLLSAPNKTTGLGLVDGIDCKLLILQIIE
jgi:hypothetical protein